MRKNRLYTFVMDKLFGNHLAFRVRLFNALAMVGILAPFIAGLTFFITQSDARILLIDWAASATAFGIMYYATKTQKYVRCYYMTIGLVFLALFPYLYFTTGGYGGGMPFFFVFAIVFTAFMLEKRTACFVIALELAVYVGCYVFSLIRPDVVKGLDDLHGLFFRSLVDFVVVAVSLAGIAFAHFGMYNRQQKQLADANKRLSELDRTKTEFYQDMHHEMKTPLHVISTYIQNADDMLDFDIDKMLIRNKLESAEREIVGLARLIEHSIDLTAAQIQRRQMEPLDFAALLRDKAGVFRALVERDGNRLMMDIPDGLPELTGNAGMLSQVIFNLMYNAHRHTKNGVITVSLGQEGNALTTSVRDTGEGIGAELLPRVFERGVSSAGTGYGLTISKTIIEMHGGSIGIESEPGKGTAVTFTLPIKAETERGETA
jgi:signal transduction histidine kinase